MKNDLAPFLASLFLSKLADQVLLFLVPLVVYQQTGSVAWSGWAFFAETLPRYLAFPVCGALCDRRAPLALLRTSQIVRALVCVGGVLASLMSSPAGAIVWLIALSAVCGVLTTQGFMAREVMLPHVFRHRAFQQVLAHTQTADQLGAVLGPVLAALLLGLLPWQAVVAATAALFVAADVLLMVWRRLSTAQLPAPQAEQGAWFTPVAKALAHVRDLPGLMRLVVLAAGVNLVIGATLASSAALVTGHYAQSAGWYAGLQTAGAVATVLILMGIAHSTLALRTMAVSSYVLICAGGVATALSPGIWGYAAGFLLVTGFDKMFNIFIRTSRQKIIPPADYGKTTGVIVMLNNLSQPVAGLLVGAFAGPLETGWVILALSLLMALIGAVASIPRRPAAS